MKFLLDTNVLIHAVRQAGQVRQRMRLHGPDELATSVITLAELLYGVRKSATPAVAERTCREMLDALPVLDFTADCAPEHARIRYDVRHSPIGERDLMIAAMATTHNLTLVTHNHAEFARVPGLTWIDWFY